VVVTNFFYGELEMKSMIKVFSGVAAALLLGACDSDDDVNLNQTLPAPLEQVQLQLVHAVANAPTVSVGNTGSTFITGLRFKETSGFVPFAVGTLAVQVDADVPGGQATVIPSTDVDLVADTTYSVLAIGEVGSMANPIAPLVISNAATPVGAGNVRVEVVHGAPNAPPVDIHVTAPADPIVPANAIAGGNTPFGANSGQLEVPAGDYRIRVTLPGDTAPVFDSGTVALPAGADLLVVAVDNTVAGRNAADAPPITLLVSDGQVTFEILDALTPAEVRVVHAVPDAPAVDVYLNDPMAMNAPPISGLGYKEVFPTPGADSYAPLAAGTNNVLVTVSGNVGAIAIPATDLDLVAGQQYSVYASGTLATIAPFVTEDDDRSIGTEARVRIIHLAPSAGLVDLYVTAVGADINNESPTLEDVDFQADTGYLSLPGMAYDVTVTLAGTKTIAIGPATVTLSDGGVYTAVARDPDPNVANDPFGLILLDDF
jgi:hypothetical protein